MLVIAALWGFFIGGVAIRITVLDGYFKRSDSQTVTARVQRHWIGCVGALIHVWAALAVATYITHTMEVTVLFWGGPLQHWFFHPIILVLICWVPSQSAWHEWRRSQIHAVA